jgi:hypothetical protein
MPLPAWAPIAASAVGSALSALGGASASKQSAKDAKFAREQQERMGYAGMDQNERQFGFNANMGRSSQLDQRAIAATDMEGRLNRSPIADQAQYLIQQRLGMGNVVNGMGNAAASYRPGMGGVDTTQMRTTFNRLRDESQVPGAYDTQTGGEMRMTAYRDELMAKFAQEKDPQKRDNWAKRIAEVDRIIAAEKSGGSGTDNYDRDLWVPSQEEKERMVQEMLRQRVGIPGLR